MKRIEIVVSPAGESRVETRGFAGGECRSASQLIEATLGKTTSETLTAEFYQAELRQNNQLEQET